MSRRELVYRDIKSISLSIGINTPPVGEILDIDFLLEKTKDWSREFIQYYLLWNLLYHRSTFLKSVFSPSSYDKFLNREIDVDEEDKISRIKAKYEIKFEYDLEMNVSKEWLEKQRRIFYGSLRGFSLCRTYGGTLFNENTKDCKECEFFNYCKDLDI